MCGNAATSGAKSCLAASRLRQCALPSAGSASGMVVLVAACGRSSRRMSAKIAGRASSAIAPSTQNADRKPPVSALGSESPERRSASVWPAATLEAIAIPIAAPSC